MNEEERIREEVIKAIKKNNMAEWTADQILSIKGIRIEADNQDLPEHRENNLSDDLMYHEGQQDMLKDGWVKVK